MGTGVFDNEVEEQDVEITEQGDGATEAPSQSREDVYADAEREGVENALFEELQGKDNLTVEDLRKIPGTENLSDKELLAHWARVNKTSPATEETPAGETKIDLPFPVYDAQGNKLAKDKVTLEALLKGDLQLGYNAMGKEHRKSLADVVRNASQGHWNEHRYTTVQGQLTKSLAELKEAQTQVAQYNSERTTWNAALTALIAGDKGPMTRLVDAYQQALTTSGAVPKGFISEDTARAERELHEAGVRWMEETGMPAAFEIAQKYEANPKEVLGAIKWFAEREPMLTNERLQEIIAYDVPMAYEANGYTVKATDAPVVPSAPNNELAQLKETVAALQKRIAETGNAATAVARDKTKKAPPSGSGSVQGAGDAMPSFKSRAQFKAWSQDDPEWAKA